MQYLGSIAVDLYGASSGVVDLGEGGWNPHMIVPQADLRTNTTYNVGISILKASSNDIGTNFASACTGLAFANQPANDGVEILSDSAEDVQPCTIYGTTYGTNKVVAEVKTLTGVSAVSTTKTDWGYILGVELSSAAVGTVTIREASGNATITTIAAAASSSGITSATNTRAFGLPIRVFGSGATTKVVGAVGTDAAGRPVYDAITLSGTTAVNGIVPFIVVSKLLYGDLESSRTATFEVGNLTYGTAASQLSTLGSDNDGDQLKLGAGQRYLHWSLVNGTTAATGGVNDRLLVKLYG